jgi:hypothetical protein
MTLLDTLASEVSGVLSSGSTGVTGTQSLQAQRQTAVIFEEYGDNLYFDRGLLEGDTSGVAVLPTKAEKRAEESASVVGQRSISASGQ